MFLLFEEAGKFLAGRVLSEADASSQVELDSGKRVKVKQANGLIKFEKPEPAAFLAAAQAASDGIELEMAWEFAPDEEFGFADLAREYFSSNASKPASLDEQAAMLWRLFHAPHYFRRAGKGRFRKASADVIAQALAAIEKKKQLTAQIDQWAQALVQGECPQPVRDQLYKILFRPDKNAAEYRAVVDASRAAQLAPLDLLQRAGAIASPYQFHWQRFLFDNFPKGIGFGAVQAPPVPDELPLAAVQAFSIDDSATTEIDDALSVQGLGSGTVVVGIHIAAPALAIAPGSAIDQLGRARLSTVYMPGFKITMLPDAVVQTYTLQEGRDCPTVSLYVTLDEATLEVKATQTLLQRVPIVANLRHDQLDALVTQAWLDGANPQGDSDAALSCLAESPVEIQDGSQPAWHLRSSLSFLYRLACHLKAAREVVRGKPENFNRPDYNFRLGVDATPVTVPDGGSDSTESHATAASSASGAARGEPTGHETVQISTRQRGAPLDLMVAECMILANSTWGSWMADLGVPGIYRSQASLAPGVKVRMGTKALPHAGIGVKSYAWSTSPLRRYTDLVNQWQIIACARHGKTAALAAPFKPKDADLFSIISSFDAAYSAYNGYQAAMERFWTLKYLLQQDINEVTAVLFKDNMVRCDNIPLVLAVMGAADLPRGARVRVKLGQIDEISLDVGGTVIERLDADPAAAGAGDSGDSSAKNGGNSSSDDAYGDDYDDSSGDNEPAAGPIAIALDLDDEPGTASGAPGDPERSASAARAVGADTVSADGSTAAAT